MYTLGLGTDDRGLIKRVRRKARALHPARSNYLHIKRVLDIVLILAVSPLWLPLFIACFLLVKGIDPSASAFFVQPRTGLNGVRFNVLKFRSMVPNAHGLCAQLASLNERRSDQGTDYFKMRKDPRVTAIGRVLRKYHMDELPQLFNVIRGEMSLVGPRPTALKPDDYHLWQTERFEVPPGLTGLWQLHEEEFPSNDDRMRLDIIYGRQCCLSLDIRILLLTARHVLAGRGC
jgi:lipopolysaccharide/colanic/teichoic acid biosynthesis glycosyltransferase